MTYTDVTSLNLKANRQQFAKDVAAAIAAHAPAAEIRENVVSDDWRLSVAVPGALGASVWWLRGEDTPMISWHGATRPLRDYVKGAWIGINVNQFHRRKASSFPTSLDALIARLVIGLGAAADGSAFLEDADV